MVAILFSVNLDGIQVAQTDSALKQLLVRLRLFPTDCLDGELLVLLVLTAHGP